MLLDWLNLQDQDVHHFITITFSICYIHWRKRCKSEAVCSLIVDGWLFCFFSFCGEVGLLQSCSFSWSLISSIGQFSTHWTPWSLIVIDFLHFFLCLSSSYLCLLSPSPHLWVAGSAWPSPLREKQSSSHSRHIRLWKTCRVLLLRKSPFPRKMSWIWGRPVWGAWSRYPGGGVKKRRVKFGARRQTSHCLLMFLSRRACSWEWTDAVISPVVGSLG